MRFDLALIVATLFSTAAAGAINPQHAVRSDDASHGSNTLFKRKGGGGGGGRGGGGGGGGSSGGGSSGGGRGGSGGSSGGSGGSSGGSSGSSGGTRGNTGTGSNSGGTSRGGTGPPRIYGGGGYYGGGSATPYRAGAVTALGIGAIALTAAALAFWPGTWHHGAYIYPYPHMYTFHNATTDQTESLPVVCACAMYAECGCDENNSTMSDLVGNGTYQALNKSIINKGVYKNQESLLINGTLPNGTTADGPDGSDGSDGSDSGTGTGNAGAGAGMKSLVEASGMWPVLACVIAAVFLA